MYVIKKDQKRKRAVLLMTRDDPRQIKARALNGKNARFSLKNPEFKGTRKVVWFERS
jgi:hypothetical protein